MAKKQMTLKQLANLPQYRDKSEEELQEIVDTINSGGMEGKIKEIMTSFEADYDLSEMTSNDLMSLEELARIFILLDKLEERSRFYLEDGEITEFEKVNRVASGLRNDASRIQTDLNITRKARQNKGDSVEEVAKEIKTRALHFLRDRLCEVYCPSCKMLVAKVWWLYDDDNEIKVTCARKDSDFHEKPYTFTVKQKDFVDNKNIKVGPPNK